jgi:hypothetical protein
MRRLFALAVGLLASAAVVSAAGCTFLISFDDVARDAAGLPDRTIPGDDGDTDADTSDSPVPDAPPGPFPPPCDTSFPLDKVKCDTSFPRPNCARSTGVVTGYPAGVSRGDDLVTCLADGGASCVQHCPSGCLVMPSGYPDQCDDCAGKKDGTYCIKDLRGFAPENVGLAVDCVKGKGVEPVHTCGNTAASCASSCPRATPKPACCI